MAKSFMDFNTGTNDKFSLLPQRKFEMRISVGIS
jgi:hypothetical protein